MGNHLMLQNNFCKVSICEVPYQKLHPEAYSQIFNPANYANNELSKAFAIHLDSSVRKVNLLLIGSHLADVENCALLDGQNLIVMLNEQFFKINVLEGTIADYKALDVFGSHFALYKIAHGYVVHGEVEILFLNEKFDRTAHFTGRDIFVSASGKTPFVLTQNTVQLYDFEDNYYEINFSGNIVNKRMAE